MKQKYAFWAALAIAFSSLVASAQTLNIPDDLFSNPAQQEKGNVWLEINFPITQTGPFNDAREEQENREVGIFGGAVGWEPFAAAAKKENSKLMSFLKSVGFSMDVSMTSGSSFPSFLYTYEKPITQYNYESTCLDPNGRWDYSCTACKESYGYYGYCEVVSVYGRDTYVKYTRGSVAFGAYLPAVVAKRIIAQGGVKVRFHFLSEGKQTDSLTTTVKKSLDLSVGVGYLVTKNASFGFNYEKSVKGLPYSSKAVQFTYRFPENQ